MQGSVSLEPGKSWSVLQAKVDMRADEGQLNRELHHRNLVALREVILEDKSIYMVFEYAEHDFLVCPLDD